MSPETAKQLQELSDRLGSVYTKSESDLQFSNLNQKIETDTALTKEVLEHVKRTNGRVRALELWKMFIVGGLTIIAVLVLPILFIFISQFIAIK